MEKALRRKIVKGRNFYKNQFRDEINSEGKITRTFHELPPKPKNCNAKKKRPDKLKLKMKIKKKWNEKF